ncbi:MAG: hypothetical protein VR70_01985 [Rhodospirillaceae bacterium BRH_c57]|nr:MAG: hypothetical protein VR70_01985 [Rhodospirillaceae bacterium BRH_c57]
MRISLMTTLMASALALGTAANAQQTPPSETQAQQPSQQMQEQQSQAPSGQAEGADIQVQQQPPEVIVRQPDPQVTVEQGEPNVEVTREGEPDVRIEEQAQQQEQTEQLTEEERQQRAQEAQTGAATPQTETETEAMTTDGAQTAGLEQLMDKEVYGSSGEQVGEVTDVLIDDQGQPQMVIVEHGGFLGIGSREVAFEMNQVQVQGDQIQVPATQDQISEMPEWDESQIESRGYTSQRVTTEPAGQTGTAPTTTTTTTRPAD